MQSFQFGHEAKIDTSSGDKKELKLRRAALAMEHLSSSFDAGH